MKNRCINSKVFRKPCLLFVSAQLPSLKVPQAGHKIAYSNLEKYSREYEIYLLSSVNEFEEKYVDMGDFCFCKEIFLYRVDNIRRILCVMNNPFIPIRGSVKANRGARNKIISLVRDVKFELVHFEFTSAGYYMNYVSQDVKKVFSEHDITYQAYERKKRCSNIVKRLLYSFEQNRQKKWELAKLSQADEVMVLNEKDRDILVRDGIPSGKIRIVRPYVSPSFGKVHRENIESHSILFWGAMNRKENVDAVLWFVKDIYPLVLRKYKDAKLYIAGGFPPAKISNLKSENIIPTGFIDDPLEYFEKTEIAIAPLRMGAGIKVKVLEYLEAGLPVVSTSVGAEGIESKNVVVADDPIEFANAIIHMFSKGK